MEIQFKPKSVLSLFGIALKLYSSMIAFPFALALALSLDLGCNVWVERDILNEQQIKLLTN